MRRTPFIGALLGIALLAAVPAFANDIDQCQACHAEMINGPEVAANPVDVVTVAYVRHVHDLVDISIDSGDAGSALRDIDTPTVATATETPEVSRSAATWSPPDRHPTQRPIAWRNVDTNPLRRPPSAAS